MITRAQIISKAREYIGTPCIHQGRLKGIGVDCIGLIVGVAKELGLPFFGKEEFRTYRRKPDRGESIMLRYLKAQCIESSLPAKPGDIMVFWTNRRGVPHHMGIANDTGGMIHAFTMMKIVAEHPISTMFTAHLMCAFSYPGVTD
jgi:cell wall-associated NlpC family hydrolase